MRYTTDDMRNWAGSLDEIALSIGGEKLAMKEAADEIDRLRTSTSDLLKALKACVEALDSDEMKGVWSYLYAHSYQWTGPTVDMIAARAAILKATSSSSAEGAAPQIPEPPKG